MASVTSLSGQSSIYSLVSNLMLLERQPIAKLQTRKQDMQTLSGIYSDLKTKLTALKSSTTQLTDAVDSPLSARKVSSSIAGVVTATATSSAALGSHSIFVSQLAKSHTMVSSQFASDGTTLLAALGTGEKTFSLTVNDVATSVTVTIGAEDTNEEIIAATSSAINAAMANVTDAVSATALEDTGGTGKLVLRSQKTGADYKMTLADTSGTLLAALGIDNEAIAATATTGGYIHADAALDARLTVDGVEIVRSSNVISDAINSMTLTLHAGQDVGDNAADLTIEPDSSSIKSTVDDFIAKFNATVTHLKSKTAIDTTKGTRQPLSTQSLYRNLLNDLRTTAASAVDTGSAGIFTLADIGIAQADNGTLSITDVAKFNDAVGDNPTAVKNLFSATGGIATQLEAVIEPFTKAGGHLDSDSDNMGDRIEAVDSSIARQEARMVIREKQLIAQYSHLQEALATLNGQRDYLGSFLSTYQY